MTVQKTQTLTLASAFQLALEHHMAGRFQEAEPLYRAIVEAQPAHPDANHNLGVLAMQVGQPAAGIPFLKAALAINPGHQQYPLSYAEALLLTDNGNEAQRVLHEAVQGGLNSPATEALRQRIEASLQQGAGGRKDLNQYEINLLVSLFNTGNFADLEKRASELLEKFPNSGFAWKVFGAALKEQGKDALAAMQKAAELSAEDADAHSNLGNVLLERGEFKQAIISCRRALALRPDFAIAHNNLGNALLAIGEREEARDSFQRAVDLAPDFFLAHNNLGNVLKESGELDKAIASYRQALAVNPDFSLAYYNLAASLHAGGDLSGALANYQRALQLNPDDADTHNNLGNVLKDRGCLKEAALSYEQSLRLKPDFALAHSNLGNALKDMQQLDEALASYQRALAIQPSLADVHNNVGIVYEEQGLLEKAKVSFEKAYAFGCTGAKLRSALMLPPIMGTKDELTRSRQAFELNVDELLANPFAIEDPLTEVGTTNFYLAYHGMNDRDIQIKLASFYEKSCPSLLYSAPHCLNEEEPGGRKKVGFLSKFIYTHSVSRCFSRVVKELAEQDNFDVSLISSHNIDDPDFKKVYSDFSGQRVHLPLHLEKAREIIAALQLDVLIYLDIGMEPLSYFLAFARLAKVQCVAFGHPVTTGIRNVDYFLSSELMESADADQHYSEKLVRFPIGTFVFERPQIPARLKSRKELGLPESGHIYMCPMKLQKLHPDFDQAINEILKLDESGSVILFDDHQHPNWTKMLLRRFEQTIAPAQRERIVFLPWINDYQDFISANAAADVILDPFHFGIGSTMIATFAVGTPLVTYPGEFLRGRAGLGFYKMIGMSDMVASSFEEYPALAINIASNSQRREMIKQQILASNDVVYDNYGSVTELVEFLKDVS